MGELTESESFWKAHVEAAEAFDGPATEYARLHDISIGTLYTQRSRLRRRAELESTTKFVRVSPPVVEQRGVLVALPNGVRLSLPDLDAPGLLERLARL